MNDRSGSEHIAAAAVVSGFSGRELAQNTSARRRPLRAMKVLLILTV
jgi:hypothetical protein